MSIENPDADRFEQLRSVVPDDLDDADELDPAELPPDANLHDVADQHRSVYFDEDDLES